MTQAYREDKHRWVPVMIACALLVGTAMWASTLLPSGGERAAAGEVTSGDFPQVLTVRDGQLVLLATDSNTVLERYEVYLSALPEEEQQRLTVGVTVSSEEELATLLENYAS